MPRISDDAQRVREYSQLPFGRLESMIVESQQQSAQMQNMLRQLESGAERNKENISPAERRENEAAFAQIRNNISQQAHSRGIYVEAMRVRDEAHPRTMDETLAALRAQSDVQRNPARSQGDTGPPATYYQSDRAPRGEQGPSTSHSPWNEGPRND